MRICYNKQDLLSVTMRADLAKVCLSQHKCFSAQNVTSVLIKLHALLSSWLTNGCKIKDLSAFNMTDLSHNYVKDLLS